jgi:hypothetical protein
LALRKRTEQVPFASLGPLCRTKVIKSETLTRLTARIGSSLALSYCEEFVHGLAPMEGATAAAFASFRPRMPSIPTLAAVLKVTQKALLSVTFMTFVTFAGENWRKSAIPGNLEEP